MSPDVHQARFDLTGRRALVTGASRGLGWEIARAMAEAGAHVLVNGRDGNILEERCADLAEAGLSGEPVVLDVTDTAATSEWLGAQAEPPDVLVNNVGLRYRQVTDKLPPEDFAKVVDVNLTSAYGLARGVALRLSEIPRDGAIINITSIAGPRARAGDAAYTAAKGGLESLTRSLAVEMAPRGIRCNAIAPGYFSTEANAAWLEDADVTQFVETRIPSGRWGRPDEIAGAAVFLASPAASYVNGHVLVVDAGLTVSF